MKKLIVAFLIVVGLLIGSIYIFIPSKIPVSSVRYIKAYQNTVLKFLTDNQKMNEWLESVTNKNKKGYNYKGFNYTITRTLSNITELSILSNKINVKSNLISQNVYLDSSVLQWATEIEAGSSPLERISNYRQAKRLKESISGLMDQMKIYLDNSANMYGIVVKETQLKDSVVITSKIQTTRYPGTEEIYTQVNKLYNYAASKGATATNSPMLHVNKMNENNYESMIGLPISKIIGETQDIRIKRMPYGGNMFIADVKGGPHVIQKGLDNLSVYLVDSKRTSPAIPFELMLTDRSKVSDTTKWITRLYYPIM